MFYCKYIKTYFGISNMHSYELHLDKFKDDFLNISFFQIVVSQPVLS